MNTVKDLDLLGKEQARIQELQAIESAKGNKANDKVLVRLAYAINALCGGRNAAAHRKNQFASLHNADDNNERQVKQLDNKQSQALKKLSGILTLSIPFIAAGCALAKVDPSTFLKMLELSSSGVGALGNVSEATDKAAQQETQYGGGRIQSKIQDDSQTYQASMQLQAAAIQGATAADQASAAAYRDMAALR